MTETQPTNSASTPTAATASSWRSRWLYPLLRIAFLVFAAWLIWYIAGHWDRWTGAARFESTDDAFVAGDVTPLSARVSGYITEMPVNDFQTIRKGDLIAVIDPSDYNAQLDLAQANLAAAEATLANLENQRAIQQALVREAQATIDSTEADVLRYQLEDKRQRDLFKTGIAGTQQLVEQADDNAKKAHRPAAARTKRSSTSRRRRWRRSTFRRSSFAPRSTRRKRKSRSPPTICAIREFCRPPTASWDSGKCGSVSSSMSARR